MAGEIWGELEGEPERLKEDEVRDLGVPEKRFRFFFFSFSSPCGESVCECGEYGECGECGECGCGVCGSCCHLISSFFSRGLPLSLPEPSN